MNILADSTVFVTFRNNIYNSTVWKQKRVRVPKFRKFAIHVRDNSFYVRNTKETRNP